MDANTVSHLIKQHQKVTQRIVTVPMAALCISAITEGEMQYGLAKRPDDKRLHLVVDEFLRRVDVLSWDSAVAKLYGVLRAELECNGKLLSPLDLQIAAHALSVDAVLVSNDQAFGNVAGLEWEDWTV